MERQGRARSLGPRSWNRLLREVRSADSLHFLEEVNADGLSRPAAKIIRQTSWWGGRGTRNHENYVLPLHLPDNGGCGKRDGASGAGVRTYPGVGGAVGRKVRPDKHLGVREQAVVCRILLAEINRDVAVFRAICSSGVVDVAAARAHKELSAKDAICGRKSRNRTRPLPIIGGQGGLQGGTSLGSSGIISERRSQDSNIVVLGNVIQRSVHKAGVLGSYNRTDVNRG